MHAQLMPGSIFVEANWRLTQLGFQGHLCVCVFSVVFPVWWLQTSRASDMSAQAPEVHVPGESQAEAVFPFLTCAVTSTIFSIRSKSVRLVHMQENGNQIPLVVEIMPQNLQTHCKATMLVCLKKATLFRGVSQSKESCMYSNSPSLSKSLTGFSNSLFGCLTDILNLMCPPILPLIFRVQHHY